MLAPVKRFTSQVHYREWLSLAGKLRSFPPETESVIKAAGFTIRFSDASALLNMYENIFLNELYRFSTSSSQPVILDCGANIGLSVLWLAKNYPEATILAFEADPFLFRMLQLNMELNNIKAALRNEAVWNQNTSLNFSSSKKQNGRIDDSGSVTIKAIRLKEVLQTFKQIDFLKLDVEGAEYVVLNDCMDELHKVNHLFVEFHFRDSEMNEALSIIQSLCQNGFRCLMQTPVIKTPFFAIHGFQTLDVYAERMPG